VVTLCNTTHNITCKACQPNSWSYAGRSAFEPCLCNAGYELQGWLCVACPVGKARQSNANNSIMCEVCAAGTFTPVSDSITCGACSPICQTQACKQVLYDFTPYNSQTSWRNYAASIGAYSEFSALDSYGIYNSGSAIAFIQLTLLSEYNFLTVNYRPTCCSQFGHTEPVTIYINGIAKQTAFGFVAKEYSQTYTSGTVLKIEERNAGFAYDIKITLRSFCDPYVRHECNASRDVICQKCQTCGLGFFVNNTCGANYINDRLDTQCVPCPAGSYCPTGSGPPIQCPDNGKSPPGSDDLKDCDCDPGYFRDVDGCSLCHFDYYCLGKQIQYAIACPPDSRWFVEVCSRAFPAPVRTRDSVRTLLIRITHVHSS
jgi:hypothetical protein